MIDAAITMENRSRQPAVPRPPTVLSQTAAGLLSPCTKPLPSMRAASSRSATVLQQSLSMPLLERTPSSPSKPRVDKDLHDSQRTKPLVQSSRADGGPSTPARRENLKREAYGARIQSSERATAACTFSGSWRATGHSGSKGCDVLEGLVSNADTVDHMAEAFHASMQELDTRLEDLKTAFRDTATDEEKAERERKEAERKRREIEKARARKRAQDARDPHLKIALKLEQKRSEEDGDDLANGIASIPMQHMDIVTSSGREQLSLVDVRMLRARCQQLDEGASVDSLIQLQRQRDHQVQLQEVAARARLSARTDTSSLSESDNYQERRQRVLNQKEAKRLDGVLKRLNRMRSDIPENLPCSFESLQRHIAMGGYDHDLSEQVATIFDASTTPVAWRQSHASVTSCTSTSSRKPVSPKSSMSPRGGTSPKSKFRSRATLIGRLKQNQRTKELEDIRRQSHERHMAIFRGGVCLLMLFFRISRRNRHMDVVKTIVSDLGEWARIKFAVHRMLSAVKILQLKSRDFLALRQKRIEILQKEWVRVEEIHLDKFFKSYADTVMAERYGATDSSQGSRATPGSKREESFLKQEFYKKLQEGVKEGLVIIDWNKFRIPVEQRKDVLGHYYRAVLRKRVRMQSNIIDVVQETMQKQREFVGFLAEFGADVSATESLAQASDFSATEVQRVALRPFWHASEDTILHLIAIAAQSLTHVDPFHDHPANRDVPGNEMYKRPTRLQTGAEGEDIPMQVSRLTQRSREPLRRLSTKMQPSILSVRAVISPKEDGLEEIFRSFSPRMRKINEEQTLEYQMDVTARTQTPGYS